MPGGSGKAYKDWLKAQPEGFRPGIKVATLDPFRGYANAIDEQQVAGLVKFVAAFFPVVLNDPRSDHPRQQATGRGFGRVEFHPLVLHGIKADADMLQRGTIADL